MRFLNTWIFNSTEIKRTSSGFFVLCRQDWTESEDGADPVHGGPGHDGRWDIILDSPQAVDAQVHCRCVTTTMTEQTAARQEEGRGSLRFYVLVVFWGGVLVRRKNSDRRLSPSLHFCVCGCLRACLFVPQVRLCLAFLSSTHANTRCPLTPSIYYIMAKKSPAMSGLNRDAGGYSNVPGREHRLRSPGKTPSPPQQRQVG